MKPRTFRGIDENQFYASRSGILESKISGKLIESGNTDNTRLFGKIGHVYEHSLRFIRKFWFFFNRKTKYIWSFYWLFNYRYFSTKLQNVEKYCFNSFICLVVHPSICPYSLLFFTRVCKFAFYRSKIEFELRVWN